MSLRSITSAETDALRNMAALLRAETYTRRNDPSFNLDLAKIDMDVLLYLIRLSAQGKLLLNDRVERRLVGPKKPQHGLVDSTKWPSDFDLVAQQSAGVVEGMVAA